MQAWSAEKPGLVVLALTSSDVMGSQSEPPVGFRPQAQEGQSGPDPPGTGSSPSSSDLSRSSPQIGGGSCPSWSGPASSGLSQAWV